MGSYYDIPGKSDGKMCNRNQEGKKFRFSAYSEGSNERFVEGFG